MPSDVLLYKYNPSVVNNLSFEGRYQYSSFYRICLFTDCYCSFHSPKPLNSYPKCTCTFTRQWVVPVSLYERRLVLYTIAGLYLYIYTTEGLYIYTTEGLYIYTLDGCTCTIYTIEGLYLYFLHNRRLVHLHDSRLYLYVYTIEGCTCTIYTTEGL